MTIAHERMAFHRFRRKFRTGINGHRDRLHRCMSIGVVFGSLTPPEELTEGAALAERLGFGDLWFSEDCFFTVACPV